MTFVGDEAQSHIREKAQAADRAFKMLGFEPTASPARLATSNALPSTPNV